LRKQCIPTETEKIVSDVLAKTYPSVPEAVFQNILFSYEAQLFLGHRFIENTQLYIQLDKKLFANVPDDKFIIRAVHSIEEATQLGEVGFEPFIVIQGVQ
jgi:hypothetical protein